MSKVQAYVYDITQGMARQMSMAFIGKQIDIIPHTGIVVFGKEYFFGSGPCIGPPGASIPVPTSQILDLGETSKTCDELEAYINSCLAAEHSAENYNLLSHNCNHYADAVAKFLLDGKGLPPSIVNIAEEALSTPQGQSLRVMIEGMERSMRQNMGGGSALNPFGNVGGNAAPPTPTAAPTSGTAARQEPAATMDPELEAALREIASASVDTKRVALQTLVKITENVEKNPAEPKFRRIKMSNAIFTKKIEVCSGAVDAMVAAGWLPDVTPEGEDAWILSEDAVQRQPVVKQRFAQELAKLPAPAPAVPQATPQPAAAPTMPGGFPGGFPGGLPGGLPGGINPQMMQQAQQMMQSNPQLAAQAQQMMNNPQMMAQMQQMMGGMGGPGGGFPGGL
jgi:hypothetical protein